MNTNYRFFFFLIISSFILFFFCSHLIGDLGFDAPLLSSDELAYLQVTGSENPNPLPPAYSSDYVNSHSHEPLIASLPEFESFIPTVHSGEDEVTGVYVPGVMALQVLPQAPGSSAVTGVPGAVTRYNFAHQLGSIGLLAHNYLSGKQFSQLSPGMEVRIVYGTGSVETFEVSQIHRFQATDSDNFSSPFIELDTGVQWMPKQVFNAMYRGGRVTFQTCIADDSTLTWGIVFVIAE
jgi:hypothetical protein